MQVAGDSAVYAFLAGVKRLLWQGGAVICAVNNCEQWATSTATVQVQPSERVDTLAFKYKSNGQPKRHRRLASLPKQCPTRSLASKPPPRAATRRRCGVDHRPSRSHPTARAAATTKRSRRRPSSSPNRGHRQKRPRPRHGVRRNAPRATTPSTRPAEEEAARAFLAENAPWLVPGKVVKPPHLDEDAPPTPPFTVPKPRLLVPPEDAEAGFRVAGGLLRDGQGPAARGAFTRRRRRFHQCARGDAGLGLVVGDRFCCSDMARGGGSSLCMTAIPTLGPAPCSVGTWG